MNVLVLLKTADGGFWSVPLAEAVRDRGADVTFALPSTTGALADAVRAAGMPVVTAAAPRPGVGPARQPAALRRLRRQLRDDLRPDVVVSHLYASALAGRLATAGTPVPHVFMSAGPLYLENRLIHALERQLCRLDEHVICSSGVLYEAYRDLGRPIERLSLIPYPRARGWAEGAPSSRTEARRALGLPADGFVACCVAMFYGPKRLVHRGVGIKGHDVLLDAWARYRHGGGAGELVLVGSGFGPGGEQHRTELRARYGTVPGLRWIDRVADVRPYYRAADVSVAPSRSENYGAAAEAGELGVPTIASRAGALPELVADGWNGWTVPVGDAAGLAAAIASADAAGRDERTRRGSRARQRTAELFDLSANGAAFAQVVEQAARTGRR